MPVSPVSSPTRLQINLALCINGRIVEGIGGHITTQAVTVNVTQTDIVLIPGFDQRRTAGRPTQFRIGIVELQAIAQGRSILPDIAQHYRHRRRTPVGLMPDTPD